LQLPFAYRQLFLLRVLINALLVWIVTFPAAGFAQVSPDTASIPVTRIEHEVYYNADDSMIMDLKNQKVYLYGKAIVKYEGMEMTAAYMEFSFGDNLVYARSSKDSLGNETGKPQFNDNEESLEASEIWYNFKTKKGIIREVRTQQGEGYIHMGLSKKQPNDEVHLEDGKYTTCDLEEPHYYFRLSKAIVIPDDKIVSGPVNLVVAGIPTPLALPFGFFPNKKREAKGILIPQYGESPELGFFLLNGGYYLPIGKNGKADLQLMGDIYSRGSWGGKTILRYADRYHYRGAFNFSYNELKRSDPEFPDYSVNREFFIRWQHEQDAKAHPYRRFSANVNAGSRNNFQNNFNTNAQDYLSNSFQSNISYNYIFPNSPFSFTANARHNQNTLTGIVNFTLPEMTMNMNRIYPFRKLNTTGVKKWYDHLGLTNIGVVYSSNLRNDITTYDSLIDFNNLGALKNSMRSGMRHTGSISTTVKIFNQKVTINPAANFTERWYLQTIRKDWDNTLQESITDTVNAFRRNFEYSFNASMTTKFYGYYIAKRGKKQTQLRHVITPSLNFTYHPDFSTSIYGYFGPGGTYTSYSPYDIGIHGKPATGESGMISMNLINNVEMKYRSSKDTLTGFKKVVLIDNFTIFTAYDIFRDSLNLLPVSFSGRTTLWKRLGLVYSGIMDPYVYENGTITDEYMFNQKKGLGRFTSNSFALTWNLRSKNRKDTGDRSQLDEDDLAEIDRNSSAYVDFSLPWTLNINYNIRTSRYFTGDKKDTTEITQSLILSGDVLLTTNWKIGFSSGYDFSAKDFTYTEINLYRDLHCWEMRFNWIPFGFRKSYMIQINVKASMLQDLKLMRRRSWYDTF
jgi:hypothetical protein